MNLTRWNPSPDLDVLRQQMDRMFNQMMSPGRLFATFEPTRMLLPSVDVYTSGKEIVMTAELPGIDPKDVTVEVTEQAVHIMGESRRETDIKEENYHRTERQFGHFERTIPLPYRIKDQEAKAVFKHGVLTIQAPLAEELKLPRAHKLHIES